MTGTGVIMSSWESNKDTFDDYCAMWDKAQAANIFADNLNPRSKNYVDNNAAETPALAQDDASHWANVYDRSNMTVSKDGDGSLLNESFKTKDRVKSSVENKPKKKTIKRKAKRLANQPNKISPDSIDSDTVDDNDNVKVTAGFSADPNFDKIVNLHHKKYNKENERNKQNPADEQKINKLEKEIKKLKSQIAKLSDEFYGNYTDNEYYT